MPHSNTPSDKREFRCDHCNGKILIPRDLPPTTGPCPHCSKPITSPDPDTPAPAGPPPAPREPSPIPAAPPAPPAKASPPPAPPSAIPEVPSYLAKSAMPAPDKAAPAPPEDKPAPEKPAPVPGAPAKIPEKRDTGTPVEKTESPAESPGKPVDIPHDTATPHENKRKSKFDGPKKSKIIPVLLVLLLLLGGSGVAFFYAMREIGSKELTPRSAPPEAGPPAMTESYIRVGWQKDAYDVLRGYMAATTAEEKLPFILNSGTLAPTLEDFYGGGIINDSDTPADAFSISELALEDRERGLFMMVYDQPPQFEMKEFFKPLASLEVQYGVEQADLLLSTLARVGNFAMEPLRVHAFFKHTRDGLKLDWEVFAQTKYRTLQNFTELPEAGQTEVFRVLIVEDVPDKKHLEPGTRTYRVTDTANHRDTARVNVKVDSETGRALSIINWRGSDKAKPEVKTATVELEWTGETASPRLAIKRFICWEFLGLGGKDSATAR